MATSSSSSPRASPVEQQRIVVVGAGEGGTTLAHELVRLGHLGPIHLIGEEDCQPYERPPLSKAMLEPDATGCPPPLFPGEFPPGPVIYHRGVTALAIDRASMAVSLSDGSKLPYDKLVLATGASPRVLAVAENEAQLHYFRSSPDANSVRAALAEQGHIVIIGTGFIALEVAAAARRHGCEVTVLGREDRVLARGVDQAVAARIKSLHEANSVIFRFDAEVAECRESGSETVLTLQTGELITASAVIVGIGAEPRTGLAREAGLTVDNGIAVDRMLTTSDPAILAIGDCCSLLLPIYNDRRVRLESWRSARDQAARAAAVLMGSELPSPLVPWFWSDQYDHGLQVAGLVDEGVITVSRTLDDDALLTFHLSAEGRLVAACGVGPGQSVAKDIKLAEMLIARQATPDLDLLRDPHVKIKSLL